MRIPIPAAALCALLLSLGACSPFAAVKPARVTPGPSLMVRGTVTPNAGEIVGWMNTPFCAEGCAGRILSPELDLAWGSVPEEGVASEVGVGLSGNGLYLEAYGQLSRGERPMGIGGRLSPAAFLGGWGDQAVYGRFELPLTGGHALLVNPGLFVASGQSPNGENHATLGGVYAGVGYMRRGRWSDVILSVSPMAYAADRTRWQENDAETGLLLTVSLGWRLHRAAAR